MRQLLVPALILLVAPPLHAQHLRDKLSDLFIFGTGGAPLVLGGTSDPNNPDSVRIHGNHFVPAAVASNGTVITFLTNSIGSNVSNIPVSAASGGSTFSFQGGVPTRTSTSAGPIFGERAPTLGRGRVLAGLARTGVHFKTLRGVDLGHVRFTFTHANSDFAGCDSIANGDCSLLGVPTLGLAILSANFGSFSPHVNLGYLYRGGEFENDAVLATLGFDHLLAPWATLAVDVISQLQVGDGSLQVPGPVHIEAPYHRDITPTVI